MSICSKIYYERGIGHMKFDSYEYVSSFHFVSHNSFLNMSYKISLMLELAMDIAQLLEDSNSSKNKSTSYN